MNGILHRALCPESFSLCSHVLSRSQNTKRWPVLSLRVEYRRSLGILSVLTSTAKENFGTKVNPLDQLDSLKSRLQTIKHPISVPSLAVLVYREEGVRGFYRGLWIPLVTITFVRMSGYLGFSLPGRVLMMSPGAASFTIYSGTKETLRDARILNQDTLVDTSLLGGLGSDPEYPSGTPER